LVTWLKEEVISTNPQQISHDFQHHIWFHTMLVQLNKRLAWLEPGLITSDFGPYHYTPQLRRNLRLKTDGLTRVQVSKWAAEHVARVKYVTNFWACFWPPEQRCHTATGIHSYTQNNL